MPIKLNGITIFDDTLKANTDLSNVTKPYVTETYINGKSGRRIWSDGFCEQWGYTSGYSVSVTLLSAYKDINYNLLVSPEGTAFGDYVSIGSGITSESSFTAAFSGGTTSASGIWWHTFGYLPD